MNIFWNYVSSFFDKKNPFKRPNLDMLKTLDLIIFNMDGVLRINNKSNQKLLNNMDFDIAALNQQNAKQDKEMQEMMKMMGVSGGAGGFNEEAELKKIMMEAGIQGGMADESAEGLMK